MKTLSANLIPRARRDAQRVASRIRAWSAVLCVVGVAAGIGYAALLNTVGGDAMDMQAQIDRTAADQVAAEAELKKVQADFVAATRVLVAAQEVRDHPDWSALLAAMAAMKGDDVVLGTLDLMPLDAKVGSATVTRPSRYSLRLTGLARDHRSATLFSLMLERTGVFSHVTLTDTSAQTIGEREAVAFGVECALDEIAAVEGSEP